MIVLIIIGAIWFLAFVIIALAGFVEATDVSRSTLSIHMGEYAWMVGKSIWVLVASLPGFIMMVSGIVGQVLLNKLKGTENKLKWTEKRLSEMILEESKAEKKEEQPRNDQL